MRRPPPTTLVSDSVAPSGPPPCPPLGEPHRRELGEASGIQPAVIAERGYRTVTAANRTELEELGFRDYQLRGLPGLLIPLHGVDGASGGVALKPTCPRVAHRPGKPDRPIKYEYPAGQAPLIDVPPRCRAALQDATTALYVTEGAKKADCLVSHGSCAINVWGVHAWYRQTQAGGGFDTIEPLPDWDPLLPTLDGRLVYLVFDSDAFRKSAVGLALRRLATFLARHGALVFIVHLPDAPDGAKLGVDDVIARDGVEAFQALVDAAEAWGSAGMVRHLQAEVRQLREQLSAIGQLLYNPKLGVADKVGTFAIATEAGWLERRQTPAPYRVNYARLARCGLSTDTLGAVLKHLDASGVASKRVTREPTGEVDDKGRPKFISTVELTPPAGGFIGLVRLAAAIGTARPKHVYHPPRCPDHPDAEVIVRRVCSVCGQVLGDAEPPAASALDWQLAISERDHVDEGELISQLADAVDPGLDWQFANPDIGQVDQAEPTTQPADVAPTAPSGLKWQVAISDAEPVERAGLISQPVDATPVALKPQDAIPDPSSPGDTGLGSPSSVLKGPLVAVPDTCPRCRRTLHGLERTWGACVGCRRLAGDG